MLAGSDDTTIHMWDILKSKYAGMLKIMNNLTGNGIIARVYNGYWRFAITLIQKFKKHLFFVVNFRKSIRS